MRGLTGNLDVFYTSIHELRVLWIRGEIATKQELLDIIDRAIAAKEYHLSEVLKEVQAGDLKVLQVRYNNDGEPEAYINGERIS